MYIMYIIKMMTSFTGASTPLSFNFISTPNNLKSSANNRHNLPYKQSNMDISI